MKRLLSFACLFAVSCLFSCKSDVKEVDNIELDGNWKLYEAYRNNSLTTTLEDGYFRFQDEILETNIIGSPVSGSYVLNKNSFQHDSELPITYEVSYYSKDTMHLNTEIQGFDFLFKLERERNTLTKDSI